MSLTLSNLQEDAYWVRLNLSFPQGLSFRKVEMRQVSTGLACLRPPLSPQLLLPWQNLGHTGQPAAVGSSWRAEALGPQRGSHANGHPFPLWVADPTTLEAGGTCRACERVPWSGDCDTDFVSSSSLPLKGDQRVFAEWPRLF